MTPSALLLALVLLDHQEHSLRIGNTKLELLHGTSFMLLPRNARQRRTRSCVLRLLRVKLNHHYKLVSTKPGDRFVPETRPDKDKLLVFLGLQMEILLCQTPCPDLSILALLARCLLLKLMRARFAAHDSSHRRQSRGSRPMKKIIPEALHHPLLKRYQLILYILVTRIDL
jgi:hypothetical protein